jgi:hypothetical protein
MIITAFAECFTKNCIHGLFKKQLLLVNADILTETLIHERRFGAFTFIRRHIIIPWHNTIIHPIRINHPNLFSLIRFSMVPIYPSYLYCLAFQSGPPLKFSFNQTN